MAEIPQLDAPAAQQLLAGGGGAWTYLDVRTQEEFAEGRAPGALNVPFMLRWGRGRGGGVRGLLLSAAVGAGAGGAVPARRQPRWQPAARPRACPS
jgi:hypothetical protein